MRVLKFFRMRSSSEPCIPVNTFPTHPLPKSASLDNSYLSQCLLSSDPCCLTVSGICPSFVDDSYANDTGVSSGYVDSLKQELEDLREDHRTLTMDYADTMSEIMMLHRLQAREAEDQKAQQAVLDCDASELAALEEKIKQYHKLAELIVDIGLHIPLFANNVAIDLSEDSLVDLVKEAADFSDSPWTAILSSVYKSHPLADYADTLNATLNLRKELKETKKKAQFWKEKALSDDCYAGYLTPSPSDLPDLVDDLSPERREAVDNLIYKRRLAQEQSSPSMIESDSAATIRPQDIVRLNINEMPESESRRILRELWDMIPVSKSNASRQGRRRNGMIIKEMLDIPQVETLPLECEYPTHSQVADNFSLGVSTRSSTVEAVQSTDGCHDIREYTQGDDSAGEPIPSDIESTIEESRPMSEDIPEIPSLYDGFEDIDISADTVLGNCPDDLASSPDVDKTQVEVCDVSLDLSCVGVSPLDPSTWSPVKRLSIWKNIRRRFSIVESPPKETLLDDSSLSNYPPVLEKSVAPTPVTCEPSKYSEYVDVGMPPFANRSAPASIQKENLELNNQSTNSQSSKSRLAKFGKKAFRKLTKLIG